MMIRQIAICWLLLCTLTASAGTYRPEQIPNVQRADARRYVSDPDGILSSATVSRIDSICASLRGEGIAEAAVVTVEDIEGGDVFDFAIELFRQWGVGRAGADNGLGILLVRGRREIRFVTGGGLEGVLTDALCKRIQMQYMLPRFREGDYDGGMLTGMQAVATLLEEGGLDFGPEEEELPVWAILAIVIGVLILPLGILLLVLYAGKRCPQCRRMTLQQQSQRLVKLTENYRITEHTYVCSHCGAVVRRKRQSLRDDGFNGGAGGTIIGGGFGRGAGGGSFGGGFGGGSFGGGGAGSKW